jgi:hypothetical protein
LSGSATGGGARQGSPKFRQAAVLCAAAEATKTEAEAQATRAGAASSEATDAVPSKVVATTSTGIQTVTAGASVVSKGEFLRVRTGRNTINGRYKCGVCGA